MPRCIVELNDQELRLARDGKIVTRSAGCAVVRGNEIEVGEDAYRQAHLHPRDHHNHFWYRLDQAPLRRASRVARHHADLAFRHLEHVHKKAGSPKTTLFVIPGGFTNEQLALLLGLAEACRIKTLALVDAAVASAADSVAPGKYRHVEIQLHRAVITDLIIDEFVTRDKVEVIDGAGYDKLISRFVAYVADQFLAQCRFDPLHQADTEQMLFNEIPNWLQALHARRETVVHIEFSRKRYEARLSQSDVISVAEPIYQEIRARLSSQDRRLIGSRLAAMPGFIDAPGHQIPLPETAVFGGCAEIANRSEIPDDGLSLVTRLKAADAPTLGVSEGLAPRPSSRIPELATHVLCGIRAFALTGDPLFLTANGGAQSSLNGRSVARLHRQGSEIKLAPENGARLRVNGLPFNNAAIVAGDEITIEGSTVIYLPIRVIEPDAP